MGFIKRTPPKPEPHFCVVPDYKETAQVGPGSIWKCDTCGNEFTLHVVDSPIPFGGPGDYERRTTWA